MVARKIANTRQEGSVRILVTSIPQVSHMFPIVPTAQALQAAGHDVLVVTQPNVAPALAGAGLAVETIGAAVDLVALYRAFLPADGLPAAWHMDLDKMNQAAARPWVQHARDVFGAQLEVARQWRPDLIICDPMELAALLTGAVLNVPVVSHRWGGPATISRVYTATAARRLIPLLRRHGLAAMPAPALIVDPCPPSIRLPDTEPGHPVRYIPYNGTGTLPAGALAGSRPRVCVSFGRVSAGLAGGALVKWTLEALDQIAGIGVTLVVSRNDLAEIGQLSDHVEVLTDVPLHLIVGQCDALVHHGGSGTGMTGLCAGIPQVVLPQIPDQSTFADLVAAAGAGRSLADQDSQRSIEVLKSAITSVLDEPAYRDAAKRLQAEIEAMPEPASIVAELQRCAATAV
jgi:UDP:flavonoid glycosyltransferase YjiC (YdhE family)